MQIAKKNTLENKYKGNTYTLSDCSSQNKRLLPGMIYTNSLLHWNSSTRLTCATVYAAIHISLTEPYVIIVNSNNKFIKFLNDSTFAIFVYNTTRCSHSIRCQVTQAPSTWFGIHFYGSSSLLELIEVPDDTVRQVQKLQKCYKSVTNRYNPSVLRSSPTATVHHITMHSFVTDAHAKGQGATVEFLLKAKDLFFHYKKKS